MNPRTKILWLDVETTGLDPLTDRLLEVAAVLTRFGSPFEQERVGSWFVPSRRAIALLNEERSAKAKALHVASGLYDEIVSGLLVSPDPPYLERCDAISSELATWAFPEDGAEMTVLAGNSIHFDRGFIRNHLFDLNATLHYCMLDVVSVKRFGEACGFPMPSKEEPPHRALADVKSSMRLAERMRDLWLPLPHSY